ncbi:protocatechuate 4,5-dioxygenase-like protein [Trypanosoma vivax]|nr:protocatechuate 4,5-dioxygenase-like protein [Trypanosoma vivax]
MGDDGHQQLVAALKRHKEQLVRQFGLPKAIGLISAHYETEAPRVGGAAHPALLYDYYGFPTEAYRLQYSAPGYPALANAIVDALKRDGFEAAVDPHRPFDHGVFVPLMLMFPKADIPVVPISVLRSGSAAEHIRMGQALRSLRFNGLLLIGSGSSMHHFGNMWKKNAGKTFGDSLSSVLCGTNRSLTNDERLAEMSRVKEMEGFDEAQPRDALEHLMPLLTIVGASGGTAATEVANIYVGNVNNRNYLFHE